MVSVQVRRSSRRSLLSCRANKYLGGGRSTEIRPQAPGTYAPHVAGRHTALPHGADGARRPGPTELGIHMMQHTTRRAPDHPELRFQGGSSETRAPRVTQTEPHARFCEKQQKEPTRAERQVWL